MRPYGGDASCQCRRDDGAAQAGADHSKTPPDIWPIRPSISAVFQPARSIPEERCGAPVLDIGMRLPQIAEVGVGTVHRGKSSATANGNTDPADQQAA
jgi:hypothetical protein